MIGNDWHSLTLAETSRMHVGDHLLNLLLWPAQPNAGTAKNKPTMRMRALVATTKCEIVWNMPPSLCNRLPTHWDAKSDRRQSDVFILGGNQSILRLPAKTTGITTHDQQPTG